MVTSNDGTAKNTFKKIENNLTRDVLDEIFIE